MTRLYLESSGTPSGGTPDVDAAWEDLNEFVRYPLNSTKAGSTLTEVTTGTGANTNPGYTAPFGQFISQDTLPAGDISGSVTCVVRCRENNTGNDFFPAIVIRVLSGDGTVVRGTLLSLSSGSTEFSTTSTNRHFANSSSLSPVTAVEGDRIVVELGGITPAGEVSPRMYADIGSNAGSDLSDDEVSTDNLDPWIEFSQDLFVSEGSSPTLSVISSLIENPLIDGGFIG